MRGQERQKSRGFLFREKADSLRGRFAEGDRRRGLDPAPLPGRAQDRAKAGEVAIYGRKGNGGAFCPPSVARTLLFRLLLGQGVDEILVDGGEGSLLEVTREPFDVADVIFRVGLRFAGGEPPVGGFLPGAERLFF